MMKIYSKSIKEPENPYNDFILNRKDIKCLMNNWLKKFHAWSLHWASTKRAAIIATACIAIVIDAIKVF